SQASPSSTRAAPPGNGSRWRAPSPQPAVTRAPSLAWRSAWRREGSNPARLLLLAGPPAVATLEALDPPAGVDQLLLAGEEGMALVAQLDVQVGLGRACGEGVAARAPHGGGDVLGVD